MSEPHISRRHASIAVSLVTLSALILLAVLASPSTGAAGATKCPPTKKTSGACPKTSKRLSYKIVRRGVMVVVPHTSAGTGESEVVAVTCPREERVLAGGASIAEPAAPFLTVTLSAPDETTTGWLAQLTNLSTTADSEAWLSVYAVCETTPAGATR